MRQSYTAFNDAFFSIIITIMVLELKIPEGIGWAVIRPLVPVFLSYALSFLFLAIYWANHHQMMIIVKHVTPAILWTNMNLLFWISLVPFATGWMGENRFERSTVAVYGALLLICGMSFTIHSNAIRQSFRVEDRITRALKRQNRKSYTSAFLYVISIPIALYIHPWISAALYAFVSIWWMIPDKKIERVLHEED